MLASILRSERAIAVNIAIVRAFVALRRFLSSQGDLGRRLASVERSVGRHGRHIFFLYDLIKRLSEAAENQEKKGRIGFRKKEES